MTTTLDRPRGRGSSAGATSRRPVGWSVQSVGEWLRSPVAPYYLALVSTAVLTGLGLVMVLSASSVGSYRDNGSSYTVFLDQLLFGTVGVALAVIGSRLPVSVWKRLAWPGIFLALALQVAVFTPLGTDFQGNRNWLAIGGFSLQPSEFGKIALVVFGAAVLAAKRRVIHKPVHAAVPLIFPFGMLLVGLVLQGHDLGTGMVMLAIIAGMLWAAGLPARWFVGLGAVGGIGVAVLAAGSANRMQRIQTWIGGICDSPHVEGCYQKVHAEYALADGGWWGLGLGESREKWGILPEPHNDFILAIIGEELGLPGSLAVLGLFAVLAYACFRVVTQAEDGFTRLAAAGVMVWFLGQALVNIGSVIGMLPIIGVPLPLVSSGGSALIAALIGVGLLLALARSLPGAEEALRGRTGTLRRTLAAVPAAQGTRSRTRAGGRRGVSRPARGSRSPGGRR
ncbi:Cell division protein FtsW [Serinicoccus hydrothermalis]|uniref:Probable peptidoglycan glycosyltransferase FtsW n=1 Tax=Serinicoccus hydrothermalis TaxID=1758689 RepID=A0A1B1NA72_9MICO|nr:putative lipid II flippase FtsW [Serinicoccus hydrothermalis]ANS78275.1 Cell division protein FtsW [Serinicoccus hydrothermalis]